MTRVVVPEPHHEVWADPIAFAEKYCVSEEDALKYLSGATWLLSALTEGRVHGGGCWEDRIRVYPGTCVVWLKNGPVTQVAYVSWGEDCGCMTHEMFDYCILDDRSLRICCNSTNCRPSCGCTDPVVTVRYEQAPNLPPGASLAVETLATEYYNASTGQPCKLPERINNVSRQGVSWTILDPQTFLKEGLTGMGSVDHWLNVAKSWPWPPVRAVDPFHGIVVSSKPIECGASFQDSAFSWGFDVLGADEEDPWAPTVQPLNTPSILISTPKPNPPESKEI